MSERATPTAILFDCDGVLVDSLDATDRSWRRLSEEYSLDADEVARVSPGRPARSTIEELVEPGRRAAALARIDELELSLAHTTRALPGTADLLAMLAPDRWAVVTSGGRELTLAKLEAAGLPEPGVLVTADDVADGKPDPAPYVLAAERLGHPPDRCVVFEDSEAGVVAGRRAGAVVVGVGGPARAFAADRHLDDLRSADEVLAELGGAALLRG